MLRPPLLQTERLLLRKPTPEVAKALPAGFAKAVQVATPRRRGNGFQHVVSATREDAKRWLDHMVKLGGDARIEAEVQRANPDAGLPR